MTAVASRTDIEAFARDGFVILRDFYPPAEIRSIKHGIYRLSQLLGPELIPDFTPVAFSEEAFDASIMRELAGNRHFASAIYDAVKKLPAYVRLACSERHEVATQELLGSEFVGFANRGYGMRMDIPFEDHVLTQLHQDFVSQLCSPAGIVFWSPLRDVTPDIGPLRVYPGTHRFGIFPIEKRAAGSSGLVMRDEKDIRARFGSQLAFPRAGDVIAAHHLLLHESSPNRADHIRWSMISRYFDFLDAEGRRIRWTGGLQEGHSFESVYPEYTVVAATQSE